MAIARAITSQASFIALYSSIALVCIFILKTQVSAPLTGLTALLGSAVFSLHILLCIAHRLFGLLRFNKISLGDKAIR